MADFDKNRFSSKKQEYETPDSIFDPLNEEFHFTLDVCADKENTKCQNYFTEQDNGLEQDWCNNVCWMNPPYKFLKLWIEKAYNESQKPNTTVVCLIPARTNTNWFHNYCLKGEVRFIKGRPKFKGCKHGLPQPLCIVIFSSIK